MARMPGAKWQPLANNWADQPRMTSHDIVCIHTMVGGLIGTDGYFRTGNGVGYAGTESHYGTGGEGEKVQWQDTSRQADANLDGRGRVISIENADMGPGFPKWNTNNGAEVPAFTKSQVEAIAQIVAWECSPAAHKDCPPGWKCRQAGIPLELIPDSKPGRRGVGYHRQGVPGYMVVGGEKWSNAVGKVCPGDRRIAQIPQIIERAKQLNAGPKLAPATRPTTSQEDDDMTPAQAAQLQRVTDISERLLTELMGPDGPDAGFLSDEKGIPTPRGNRTLQQLVTDQQADTIALQGKLAELSAKVDQLLAAKPTGAA